MPPDNPDENETVASAFARVVNAMFGKLAQSMGVPASSSKHQVPRFRAACAQCGKVSEDSTADLFRVLREARRARECGHALSVVPHQRSDGPQLIPCCCEVVSPRKLRDAILRN
jgi:hypothetical protein